jgi:serine/threonine protein kinase
LNKTLEAGKVRYMAPEVLTKNKFSPHSDVWSFGVTMWEIFSEGTIPFWEIRDTIKLAAFVVKDGGRLSKPEKCPEGVWKLMTSCWAQQPSQRPSFEALEITLKQLVIKVVP